MIAKPECYKCPLNGSRKVHYRGPAQADIMIIGEAPGRQEEAQGIPFVGDSGREQSMYLRRAGIDEGMCHITNTLLCRPPKNRDPSKEELECCEHRLASEIDEVNPKVIVTVGRVATNHILGSNMRMEMCHGLVYPFSPRAVVVPTYHPAYAMHEGKTAMMKTIADDYLAVRKYMDGELGVFKEQTTEDCEYKLLNTPQMVDHILTQWDGKEMSIDTEYAEKSPWSVQFSVKEKTGYMVLVNDHRSLQRLAEHITERKPKVIMHNAAYDLGNLHAVGIYPERYVDTMVMAYLLQDEPKGLKLLAYRKLGIPMQSYRDVVEPATSKKALEYLSRVADMEWPQPSPIKQWSPHPKKEWVYVEERIKCTKRKKGAIRDGDSYYYIKRKRAGQRVVSGTEDGYVVRRRPTAISTRAARIITDTLDKGANPFTRWQGVKPEEGRAIVESEIGKMSWGELTDIPIDDAIQYACKDADVTLRLYRVLMKRITKLGMEVILGIDNAIVPMLSDMMSNGFRVDQDELRRLTKKFNGERDKAISDIKALTGRRINPGSSQQTAQLLCDLGVFRTPTQSTDSKYLNTMLDRHQVVRLIMRYRMFTKLVSTYTQPLVAKADTQSRIHTRLNYTRVSTGRLASSDPNLQNIPARKEEGKMIRGAFIPEDGCSLLAADYSQIELKVVAHMAKDRVMLNIFNNGGDVHATTASKIFGLHPHQLDDTKHRKPAKTVGFGILYGIGPDSLASQLGWSRRDCEKLIEDWFGLYKGVKRWITSTKSFIKQHGYVVDMFGRLRYIPEVWSSIPKIREEGYRNGVNMPIQSGAGGLLKIAMSALTPLYMASSYTFRPILQIHDELIFEVNDNFLEITARNVKGIMESCYTLSMPLGVDIEIAKNWKELG